MKATAFNEEVYYTTEAITRVNQQDINWLKAKALANPRKRVRLCSHASVEDSLHEMLIVHTKETDVPVHKHPAKSESFHIIEGDLKVVIFNEDGTQHEAIEMGEYHSGRQFYYRLAQGLYHTVIPISDIVVFHEVTNGPFKKEDTVFASWPLKQGV